MTPPKFSHMPQIPSTPVALIDSAMYTALGQDTPTSAAAYHAKRRCFVTEEHGNDKLYCAPIATLDRQLTGVRRLQALLEGLWPQVRQMLASSPPDWPLHIHVSLPADGQENLVKVLAQFCLDSIQKQRNSSVSSQLLATECSTSPVQWLAKLHQMYAHPQDTAGTRQATTAPKPALHLVLAAQSQCDVNTLIKNHAAGRVGHTRAKDLPTPGESAVALLWATGIQEKPGDSALPAHALSLRAAAHSPATQTPRWPSEKAADGGALLSVLQKSLHQAQLQSWQVSHWSDDNEDQDWRSADQIQALQRLLATDSDPSAAWLAQPQRTISTLGQQDVHNTWVQLTMAHSLHRLQLQALHNLLCTVQSPNGACAALIMQARTIA